VRKSPRRLLAAFVACGLMSIVATLDVPGSSRAGADTDPTTLTGQGGSFLQPVMNKLFIDDASHLSPLFGSYGLTDNNAGIANVAGSAPGDFTADFAVSERPLTSTEAQTAKANGRSFAYIPIASVPVALATLVPTNNWSIGGSTSITPSGFCQHMPLTTTLLGEIFGQASTPLKNWNDPRITCPEVGGGTLANGNSVQLWANLDPSQSNFALMSLLDSTPGSKADFDNGLKGSGSLTTSDTPSQQWPYAQNAIPFGDQQLIGKLLNINAETNAPSTQASTWALGAITPISSVWTGAPLGVLWNLATAAVQNAQGAFVAPSLAAAQAAQADATMASTNDPTTNNLVTFNANANNAAAYNNFMMAESYLVVPTTGLAQDKAAALAQFVRFVLGSQGQQDIENFGAAPATSAMQAAGLKVAAELNSEAVASATPAIAGGATTTTGASNAPTVTTTGTSDGAPGAVPASTSNTSSSATTAGDSSGGLAFTGTSNLGAWIASGTFLIVCGSWVRRRLKRREDAL
jgi:ABC-type phosphate transport system substrate-binding protein